MATGRHAVYLQARRYVDAGLSVVPIKLDGSKQPTCAWKPYTEKIAPDRTLRSWFFDGQAGIAIVGGAVSGNLERIDFDGPGTYQAFVELAAELGHADLLDTLPLVQTPREPAGYHLYYRCTEIVEGNQPLARQLGENDRPQTIIETRGAGGYTIAPSSPPGVHPSKRRYQLLRGSLEEIPEIIPADRAALLDLCRSLNEYVEPERRHEQPPHEPDEFGGDRPGDEYNAGEEWRALLEAQGWARVFSRNGTEYWRRPGKAHGISATFNHGGARTFYVFSSNAAPLEPETSYTPFGLYTTLQHAGDYSAAAGELAGYTDHAAVIQRESITIEVEPTDTSRGLLPVRVTDDGVTVDDLLPSRGFVRDFVAYGSDTTDAPREFHLAAALTSVGALAGNKIGIHLWGQDIRPNVWAVTIAPSTFYRKSTGIRLSKTILSARCEDVIIPDDWSREELMDNLANQPAGLLYIQEFGNLLARLTLNYMAGTKEFLTEIYDGADYHRKTRKNDILIISPALSILAASTIDWICDRVTDGDIRGGFMGRFTYWPSCLKNGWMGAEDPIPWERTTTLQAEAELLHQISGMIRFDPDVRKQYNRWLKVHEEQCMAMGSHDLQSFFARLSVYVVKFAMIHEMSLSHTADITAEPLELAIRTAEYLKVRIAQMVADELASTKEAQLLKRVKSYIADHPGCTRSQMLRNMKMLTKQLDELLVTLIQAEDVMIEPVTAGSQGGRPHQTFFVK